MTSKKVEGVFETQFACKLLKLVLGTKPGYAPWNTENSLSVTFGIVVAYVQDNFFFFFFFLFCAFLSFLFYELNLNKQGFIYLEFVKYQSLLLLRPP